MKSQSLPMINTKIRAKLFSLSPERINMETILNGIEQLLEHGFFLTAPKLIN